MRGRFRRQLQMATLRGSYQSEILVTPPVLKVTTLLILSRSSSLSIPRPGVHEILRRRARVRGTVSSRSAWLDERRTRWSESRKQGKLRRMIPGNILTPSFELCRDSENRVPENGRDELGGGSAIVRKSFLTSPK